MTGSNVAYFIRTGSNHRMQYEALKKRLIAGKKSSNLQPIKKQNVINLFKKLKKSTDLFKKGFSKDNLLGVLLAMVYMGWSDKTLTESEFQLIRGEAQRYELDKKKMEILLKAIYDPPNMDQILSYLPDRESKKIAATAVFAMAWSDNAVSSEELHVFDRMCEIFDLSDKEQEEIFQLKPN